MKGTSAPSPLRLATAGIGAIATAFGMARYGYGLLLPDMERDLGLGTTVLGLIGSGAYVAYLLAALAAARAARIAGPRTTVVAGGVLATVGMLVCALAFSPLMLAAGVMVAGTSAGMVYPPFSDLVAGLPTRARARTLSAINCGTGYGVAVAAPLAIVLGDSWRGAWFAFAACAALTTAWAAVVLPRRVPAAEGRSDGSEPAAERRPRAGGGALRPAAIRMLAGAVLVGLGSAAYWTFAVHHVADGGGLGSTGSRVFLGAVGVAALVSTFTGDLVHRIGAGTAFAALALAEAAGIALLAVAPGSPVAVGASALLFGAAYNAVVAVQALWSAHLYPDHPSLGLAVAMGANALGLLAGPATAGVLADATDLGTVLLGGAVVVAAAATLGPRERIIAGEDGGRKTRKPARGGLRPSEDRAGVGGGRS